MARVLIIDDSEDLQATLEMILTDEGFEVASALDGQRGLQLTRELRPDVILLDMMMPEMDGLEFLSCLASEPSSPVVANSGFDAYRDEALRRGAVAFLLKPLSMETLVGALRSAIERRAVPPTVLAQNAARVEQQRRRALEESHRAVARLDETGIMSNAHEGLERIARWLPGYFGFGTCLVHILRGRDVCIQAMHNGPAQLYEGQRYPRDTVYCDDVMTAGSTLVLTDPVRHPSEHFAHHKEIEAGYRFYVGTPLKATPTGAVLGTLCMGDTTPHEFHTEDMRVLQSLGRGAAQGLELGCWPLDEHGIFERGYWQLFVDAVVDRAARPGGGGIVMTIVSPREPLPEAAAGLALVRLDDVRMALLWGGQIGTWSPPEALGRRVLDRVELADVRNCETVRARVQAILTHQPSTS
jgi:CheY-like chemotaxis protein